MTVSLAKAPTTARDQMNATLHRADTKVALEDITRLLDGRPTIAEALASKMGPPPGTWAHIDMLMEG